MTGLGLESLLHLLPSSVFYLVATAIASVSLITLFAVSSGNPGLAAAVSLLAPASMIGALSFRISPAIQPGWATAAATLALLGMTFLVFSLPVEAASNRDKEGQRQVGRAGGRQRPDWLFMDFFLRHWLLLFLTMAAIRPAVSYLGFGHIDLRQRVLAEILFVPLCQAFLLCFLRDRIVPWPGGKHLTGWLSSPVILLFLLLDSLLLIAPLLDESWLATLTSDEGLAHSYTGLKAAMGAMLLAGLSRRMAVRFADTIWLWAASGGLAAYALDLFPALDKTSARLAVPKCFAPFPVECRVWHDVHHCRPRPTACRTDRGAAEDRCRVVVRSSRCLCLPGRTSGRGELLQRALSGSALAGSRESPLFSGGGLSLDRDSGVVDDPASPGKGALNPLAPPTLGSLEFV